MIKNLKYIGVGILIAVLGLVALVLWQYAQPESNLLAGVIRGSDSSRGVKVNKEGFLNVQAVVESDLEHASESGLAFIWTSEYRATNEDEIIYIQNTDSDKALLLEMIEFGSASTTLWELIEVTSGTAGGTTITAQNYNLSSGVVADETAFGDASVTGTLTGNTILKLQTNAGDTFSQSTLGLILGKNDDIAITARFINPKGSAIDAGGSATTTIVITGHYESE